MLTLSQLFEAGAHFGHKARYWNPAMAPYIYGARQQMHIIDLDQTLAYYKDAARFVNNVASSRGKILFVGTKPTAQRAIQHAATACDMPYVIHRWLGGMLTNYKTIAQLIKKLNQYEKQIDVGHLDRISKKEALTLLRAKAKLEATIGGIRKMQGLPEAIFVIDIQREKTAIQEAKKLRIPVIALVDTNCNPNEIDYIIPSNDDAESTIQLFANDFAKIIEVARANLPVEKNTERKSPVTKGEKGDKVLKKTKIIKKISKKDDTQLESKPETVLDDAKAAVSTIKEKIKPIADAIEDKEIEIESSLLNKAGKIMSDVEKSVANTKHIAEELGDQAKDIAEQTVEKLKDKVEAIKETSEEKTKEVKEKTSSAVSDIVDIASVKTKKKAKNVKEEVLEETRQAVKDTAEKMEEIQVDHKKNQSNSEESK